ncbi:hypothetical protein EIP91_004207 [Steccherinum ochraceum]|uniref:Cytochrome P450 n=1 Tax=Steccherinum ochraceum TaxID=92696 RepID=A0A4R0RBS7_9APHY|nr:hypothetical protein EIP91_004207 [Steccherinum ochraceum]
MDLFIGVAVFAVVLWYAFLYTRRHEAPRIPVLPSKSILGHMPAPGVTIYEWLAKASKQYGPVFGIRILFVNMVTVNTAEAMREFFEARSSIYSGRRAPKMAELAGMSEGVLFQQDPHQLRQGRKFLASGLQPSALKAYQHVLHVHVVHFLDRVLRAPTKILTLVPMLPTGIALEIAYGYRLKDEKDPFVQRARKSVNRFIQATAMSLEDGFIVNWMPLLSYLPSFLPGMSFKTTAAEWDVWSKANAAEGFNTVKQDVANGTARPSLLQRALEDQKGTYDEYLLMRTATQVYSGGSDTTTSALKTFVLAMTLYPEAQAKAQAEIDHHMANKGAGRLPNYASDRDDLPYVHALVREVMRWHMPAPMTTRTATEDNVYKGYLVKKGTTLVVNMWSILHDEDVFPDHEVFRPERWLDGTLLAKFDADPLDVAFGFGRRVCPGKYLAIDMLFTAIVSTLTVFDIRKAKDTAGNDIVPKEEYTNRAIVAPLPFPCVVTARSDAAKQLVDNAMSAIA